MFHRGAGVNSPYSAGNLVRILNPACLTNDAQSPKTSCTAYLRQPKPSPASFYKRLSVPSSHLPPSTGRTFLSQARSIQPVSYRFLACHECLHSFQKSHKRLCYSNIMLYTFPPFQKCCSGNTQQSEATAQILPQSGHLRICNPRSACGSRITIMASCNKYIFFCCIFTCEWNRLHS